MTKKTSLGRYAAAGLALSVASLPLHAAQPVENAPLTSRAADASALRQVDARSVGEAVRVPAEIEVMADSEMNGRIIELSGPAMSLDEATAAISRTEYEFTLRDGAWTAPNRRFNMRSRITADGLTVTPRLSPDWSFGLTLETFGRQGATTDPGTAYMTGSGTVSGRLQRRESTGGTSLTSTSRVQIRYNGLTQWFINDDRGIEQGFTLTVPPAGDRMTDVVFEMAIAGDLMAEQRDARSVRLTRNGGEVMSYSGLKVIDATGRELDASMIANGSSLTIRYNDLGATYPVVVDPLLQTPANVMTSGNPGDQLGFSVDDAGDINGGGQGDIIIGIPRFDNGVIDSGAAWVLTGTPAGTVVPLFLFVSTTAAELLGSSVSSAGDIDNNGRADLLVGAPGRTAGNGRVYILHSVGIGLPDVILTSTAPVGAGVPQARGTVVTELGYHDGDVFADFAWGRPGSDTFVVDSGDIFVGFGQAAFPYLQGFGYATGFGQTGARSGQAAGHADITGDGFDDVIAGAPNFDFFAVDDGVWLLAGGGVGLWNNGAPVGGPIPNGLSGWGFNFAEPFIRQGASIGSGDFNGDGIEDYSVGVPGSDFFGAIDGGILVEIWGTPNAIATAGAPQWFLGLLENFAQFATAQALIGDTDCDDMDDLYVGTPLSDNFAANDGLIVQFHGHPAGAASLIAPIDFIFAGGSTNDNLGRSVAWANTNGDGSADALAGEPGQLPGGAAYLWLSECCSQPPVIVAGNDSYCLWPPNHRYVCFSTTDFSPTITDDCDVNLGFIFVGCQSDEPDNDIADGNTTDDCVIAADGSTFCVRSERQGTEDGRVYTVRIQATDSSGMSTQADISGIQVPHDHSAGSSDCF